ncbi:hypothetical protein TanjilG_29152 [Lupinus angustifolius]|uniref:Pectinesterase inhibitor domain-containing protein n=1 Tax=Lupinus angustifolius TaxID=3871 RepID=A0A1J7H0X8_LUPAN|nr:PREDICTED: cell wall / vacuolar inhibitor of fructosidase 1-like [Lupinus angustifolius]OIW00162.1 hypothetical protein TanjilG_29152 [Lupinus angustifolius]
MKNFNSLTLIFCLQAMFIIISIPSCHSRTFNPKNDKLIESTCKKTPNYIVCINSLKPSPGSSSADVRGLALIMVKVMETKANDALNKIHELQRVLTGHNQKVALNSCASKYNAILVADIPSATEALQKGDPKFAEDGANDAANEATYCETDYPAGTLPLTKWNNAMHDVAAVTAAIVRSLL